jgi:hypothetical protein
MNVSRGSRTTAPPLTRKRSDKTRTAVRQAAGEAVDKSRPTKADARSQLAAAALTAAQAPPANVARRATAAALVKRVSHAIERELAQIEALIGATEGSTAAPSETERRARTLASLTRTLKEIARLRAAAKKPKQADDGFVPRDIDEYRRDLARRLDRLVAEAKTRYPDEA